jgi:cytochrome c553
MNQSRYDGKLPTRSAAAMPFSLSYPASWITALVVALSLSVDAADAQPPAPAIVRVCTPCHGGPDTGNVEVPNIIGQQSIYLRKQLLALRSGQRKHPLMKVLARDLTDREIDQLVIYYSTLPPN